MRKTIFISISFAFVGIMWIPVVPQIAHAAISPTLSISPAKYDLTLIPGQVQQTTIQITNHSEVALPITVKLMDFAPKDDNGAIQFGASLPNHSAVQWMDVSPQDLLLAPQASKTVTVTMSPPDTLIPGSYFAVAMFQADIPPDDFDQSDQTQANITPWIGALFLLRYGETPQLTDHSLTINRFSVPKVSTGKTIPLTMDVSNHTNFHLQPNAEFELISLRGPIKAKAATNDTTILPGTTREFRVELAKAPPFGLYWAEGLVRLNKYEKSADTQPLVRLTWLGCVVLLFVLGILWLVCRHNKRLHQAVRALMGK